LTRCPHLAIVRFVPVLAALNPALLVAVFVMILLPDPKRLMLSYLAGAYAISIAVALVIVFSLQRQPRGAGNRPSSPGRNGCSGMAPR
jgi:hypothetical protein